MNKNSINNQLKVEAEQVVPDVFDKTVTSAQVQGLLKDCDVAANESAAKTVKAMPKRRRNLFVALTSTVAAVVICLAIVLPIVLTSPNTPTWDNLTIKDFNRYTALAAGTYETNGKSQPKLAAYASLRANSGTMQLDESDDAQSVDTQLNRLLGVDEQGNIYPVEFVENNEFVQKYGICRMITYGKFTFIVYRLNYSGKVFADLNTRSYEDMNFVLDNETGKVYNFNDFAGDYVFGASLDAFYLRRVATDAFSIYRCSLVGDTLEVREVLSGKSYELVYELFSWGVRVDRYGNIYSNRSKEKQYVYTMQGQLDACPDRVDIAANGIAYCGSQCYDLKGKLVDAEFVPDNFINLFNETSAIERHDMYRYVEDNVYYFYYDKFHLYIDGNGEPNYLNNGNSVIVKYEFLDDVRYNVEIYEIERDVEFMHKTADSFIGEGEILPFGEKFVGVNERLYFLNDSEIYYYDMKTKAYHSLTSDYYFERIYADEVGVIKFEGIDSNLNRVNGIINLDDTVDVSVNIADKQRKIYFLMPLN